MSESAYCSVVAELTLAVGEAFQRPRLLPAFLLLYVSIDVISSLTRPIAQSDTSGDIFKKWVDDYMLPSAGLLCRSEDIWAARCGFLHTLSVESKLSRGGHARELQYVDQKESAATIQKRLDPSAQKYVIIYLKDYVAAFLSALDKFSKQVESDLTLQAVVYHHVEKLVVQETIKNA